VSKEGGEQRAGDFVILPGLCAVLAPLTAIGNKAGAHVWFLLLLYYDYFFSCILQCFIIFCGAEICSDQRGVSRLNLAGRSARASGRKFVFFFTALRTPRFHFCWFIGGIFGSGAKGEFTRIKSSGRKRRSKKKGGL